MQVHWTFADLSPDKVILVRKHLVAPTESTIMLEGRPTAIAISWVP